MKTPLLHVENLIIDFDTHHGPVRAVDGVSFTLAEGETLGVVGESGCGKSVTSLALMGLVPSPPGRIVAGSVRFDGFECIGAPEKTLRTMRGKAMSMIFQEPMTALNPVFTVGRQLVDVLRRHERLDRVQARKRGVEMLERVGIPRAAERMAEYPHELSGGLRQRIMIAMALACRPRLLIADEPTTALDVTIAGAGAGRDPRTDRGAGHGGDPGHPRSRRDRRGLRPRRGDVLRADRRAGAGRRGVPPAAASLHRGPGRGRAAHPRCARRPDCRRFPARCRSPGAGRRAVASRRAAPTPTTPAGPSSRRCVGSARPMSPACTRPETAPATRHEHAAARGAEPGQALPAARRLAMVAGALAACGRRGLVRATGRGNARRWSASPAAANRRWDVRCCGWSNRPPARSGSTEPR